MSFRSDYGILGSSYTCSSDGLLSSGGKFWASGDKRVATTSIVAGLVFELNAWANAYTGVGYGSQSLAWKDITGEWAHVSDWSCKGVDLDMGIVFSCKFLVFSVGVNTVAFSSLSGTLGLGIKF